MEYPFKDLMPLDEATARDGYYKDWTHIDADTFHQISELVKFIREKGYGADTREAIAQALERVYHDAIESGNVDMELSMARKHFRDLAARLDAGDADLRNISVDWINKSLGKLDQTFMSDEFLQQMAGATPINAVPANDSLTTVKYADKSVTYEKTSFADEIALRAINLSEAGYITLDTNGDGIANGFNANGANVTNPSIVDGEQRWIAITRTFSGSMSNYYGARPIYKDHKYYIAFDQKNILEVTFGANQKIIAGGAGDGRVSVIATPANDDNFRLGFYAQTLNVMSAVSNIVTVDLTATFGAGNEPSLDYFELLLKRSQSGSWFSQANLTDARNASIKTAKDLPVYDVKNKLPGKNVNDVLLNLEDRFVTVKFIENLFKSDEGIAGQIVANGLGFPQTVKDLGNGIKSQKINVEGEDNIIMRGVRIYSFTDKDNKIITGDNWTVSQSTTKLSVPSNASWLWVSVTPNTIARVEFGDVLHSLDQYGEIEGMYVNGEKISGLGMAGDKKKELYELAKLKLENQDYIATNILNKSNAILANSVSSSQPTGSQLIDLKSSSQQKLILHLHTRVDDGYDSENDVFLPNAKSDFSDIRITDDKGTILPYKTTFKTDKFDIVGDYRLGTRLRYNHTYLINSLGEVFSTHEGRIRKSLNGGKTWTTLTGLASFFNVRLNLIAQDDSLYFNKDGMLYRSKYPYTTFEENFDLTERYEDTLIQAGAGMVQHPDGEIFFGAYQLERHIIIYKSSDNGNTWQEVYNVSGGYQHVHAMYIDVNQNPPALYAGLDKGGGILKSTDKGVSWIDLKALYNPPQSTDFGVTYAGSGYRLLGGETSVVGAHSIIKTKDDQTFYPVLTDTAGVNRVERLGNHLFGGGAGTGGLNGGLIYVSSDEGETWTGAYATGALDGAGTNDGFRHLSKVGDKIIAVNQSLKRPPLHIFPEGNYAEIIVDVPEGATTIKVESGHAYPNQTPIYNNSGYTGDKLVHFELNENSSVVKELVSGEIFEGVFEWVQDGKRLSHFYPPIIQPSENYSIQIRTLPGFKIESNGFDTSSGITISFWAVMNTQARFKLFESESGDVLECDGANLTFNGELLTMINSPHTDVKLFKYDITIDSTGNVEVFTNGNKRLFAGSSGIGALNALSKQGVFTYLENVSAYLDRHYIQHFAIRRGVVSADQISSEYHAGVTDNFMIEE